MRRWLIGLGLAMLACPGSLNGGTPEGAYAQFARDFQRQDASAAFAALSTQAQARLRRKAAEAARLSGGGVPADPARLLMASPPKAGAPTEIKLLAQDGGTALIHVKAAGQEGDVRMLREQGSWRVDLPVGD